MHVTTRHAGLVTVLALVALVAHAMQAWRNEVASWDRTISEAIHSIENRGKPVLVEVILAPLDLVLDPLAHFLAVVVVVALALALFVEGRRKPALVVIVTVAGASLLALALKELIASPPVDPGGSGFSFPSGHATRTMAAAAAIALVAWPTRWRWYAVIVGATFVLLTGIAVVYHEWHWMSDVLAGWYLALAWLGCVSLAARGGGPISRTSRAVAPKSVEAETGEPDDTIAQCAGVTT